MRFMINVSNKVLVIVVLLFIVACESEQKAPFDSFVGNWKTSMEGGIYFETWSKISDENFKGQAYMIGGIDTLSHEFFEVMKKDDSWMLTVSSAAFDPVDFKIDEFSEEHFKALNPENDFPKIISYQKTTGGLNAYITNGKADTMHFNFMPRSN